MTTKEIKTVRKLKGLLLRTMESKKYSPLILSGLCDELQIGEAQKALLKRALKELKEEGRVLLLGRKYQLSQRQGPCVGTIRILPRGFGFVHPQDRSAFPQDIFIAPPNLGGSVDGDLVEVRVRQESLSDPRGPEGEVLSIRERGRHTLAGTILGPVSATRQAVLVPTIDPRQSVVVAARREEAPVGLRVLLKVDKWGGEGKPIVCTLERVIGPMGDPSVDVPAALLEFGLASDFPKAALSEARRFGKKVSPKDMQGREDLRALPSVTIDPKSARDFDDALYLERDKQGSYHLMVHIADVSHYVRPGSALDAEALKRSNSTYFPNTCIPMLPRELSENLCSLMPRVARLAVTVKMQFSSQGLLLHYQMGRSVIESARRFTYEEVGEILAGKQRSKHGPMLQQMAELGQLLRQMRRSRGALEFALPEVSIDVDDDGHPRGTRLIEYDLSHQLVEEFMLKANEVVATHLDSLGRGATYRVHAPPAPEDLQEFLRLAQALGFKLPARPKAEEIQRLLDEAAHSPLGHYLLIAYVRTLKLATYSADNIGHYGLSLEHYCHFTSPIRRYSDLIIHRILFDAGPDEEALVELAERCSTNERLSSRAENSVLHLKKLRLLQTLWKEQPDRQWEVVITDVKPQGLKFEVLELMLEGFLHISEIGDDYYEYRPATRMLVGTYGGERFHIGKRMDLAVSGIDLIQRKVLWT